MGSSVARWWVGIKEFGFRYQQHRTVPVEFKRDIFDIRTLSRHDRIASEAKIRGLCQTAYLHDREAVCRCLGAYRLFVGTDDVGFSTFMLMDGYWEMSVTETFVELLKPGMSVVDCGANLGYYTLLAADLVGPDGHVFAYEPNPALARRLAASISVNGFGDRSTLHTHLLGDETADVVMHVPASEPKNGHRIDIPVSEIDPAAGLIAVPQRRLDDSIGDAHVDFIKIDVEGSEQRLWAGMSGILARKQPLTVLLEFASARYADPAAFLDEIAGHGFTTDVVTLSDGIRPIDRDTILNAPAHIDQMLLLRR